MTGVDRDDSREYRSTLSLDGQWEFVTDPGNAGRTESWYEPNADWPDRAHALDVPHAWQEDGRYREYTGTAWYRRPIEVETPPDREVLLRFGAVDYETTVWVDGERVGQNRGGYLPFEIDVTDALSSGENELVVAVTDPEDVSEIPHGKQGAPWYTRVSGIWQSVSLIVRPETHVVDARVTPDLETDTASVDLEVDSRPADAADVRATVSAIRGDGSVATASASPPEGETLVLDFDDPDYWTPDDPSLYDLRVTLERDGSVVDRYEDYFGMRSFEAQDGTFLLNGDPITLRGVLEQGYYPETLYRPPAEDAFEREVETARNLGFNLIRKHLKPAHPDFVEAADRQGLLVWEEPANPKRFTERSRTEVRAQIEGMIRRDYNRPSVVIWSLYNEEWGIGHYDTEETLWTDTEKQRHLADLYRDVRERDPTRVVCDNSGWAHVATDVNDYHRYFVCPDRADEWAADLDHVCTFPGDNYATTEYDDPDAPVVISELGTWGLSDVDELRERYGGDPHWFAHDYLVEPLKSPSGIDERFENTGLSDVFTDYGDLATAWQDRELVSIKHLVEEIRTHDAVAGYVLTELSDIEWECNGLLDYHREPKHFVPEFASVNGPVAVVAAPRFHAAWAGEAVDTELGVVNDTGEPVSGMLKWSLPNEEGAQTVTVDSNAIERTDVRIELPRPVDRVETVDLSVSFETADRTVSTSEPITVVDNRPQPPSGPVYAEGAFASRLAERGVTVTHSLSDDVDVAFTTEITGNIDQFASDGGTVVHLPGSDGEMLSGGPFTYRPIPRTESWNVVASFLYHDSALLEDLCPDRRLGWSFEGLYPYSVATDLDPSVDRTLVGYVEGWLAHYGSPLVVRGYGQGSMTALTFRVTDRYGDHPVATVLCDRLLETLSE